MPGRFMGMAGALIWRETDGRYLLLQRSAERDVGAGQWECVTGRLEQGEGIPDALYREVSEETGLEIQAEMFLTTSHFYRGGVQPDNEVVGVIFGCSTADGSELRLSDEHSTHRWVTVKEAADLLSSEHRLILLLTRADLARRLMPRELRDLRSLPAEQWGLRSPGGL